ncbi:Periplasmic aromatic aldehyde oxidoreductase, molybdenum binding subunit YagR [plant metagenome]|uniref:Periplasmic aromatic aldehyde oxidoreductase, molybdenum binding subunit YagR n=2 Tax=plant metagenome TaxID=1297885 RepID=A0A484UDM9_9ZZZZ
MNAPDRKAMSAMVGAGHSRVDGALKVTGRAAYTADQRLDGMVHALPVGATIARGTVRQVDTASAAAMPGVIKIYTRHNIGKLHRVDKDSGVTVDEHRPPLHDDLVRYYGQYVALVVADTFAHAKAAADAVTVAYDAEAPDVGMEAQPGESGEVDSERGDPDAAYSRGEVRLDQSYSTPVQTHNPIELHASIAVCEDGHYTLYETSQAVVNHRAAMAQMLGVPVERVRVITHYLGSGFGGKLWPWTHAVLAAAAARDLGRPVKLEITRQMMFQTVGHRSHTRQRIRLSATRAGRLSSLRHDFLYYASRFDHMKENCGEATPYLYSVPNLRVRSRYERRDMAPATSMRGPGAVPGLFALESAIDELACELGMDPVALRLMNEPQEDESLAVPFSTRHLVECLTVGARRFGWDRRTRGVGSIRRGDEILGWGVASASWLAKRLPAQVRVTLRTDGTAEVASATQDLGTGTYTVLAQMVGELTGLPLSRITVRLGDTDLPPGPLSGGSMATGSLVPAAAQATRAAIAQALGQAVKRKDGPYHGRSTADLVFEAGKIRAIDAADSAGVRFETLLAEAAVGEGKSGSSDDDADAGKLSLHSYGAHFVEVAWQPEIARLRVSRVVTVIDAGRIINPKTGRNQIEGALIMGVGMALLEETRYDARNGAPVTSNLADYLVATHADAPAIDVVFLDHPDTALNELGARGIGEIGLAGFAAAVTSAVHHATGVRVRELPVHIEDLLKAAPAR